MFKLLIITMMLFSCGKESPASSIIVPIEGETNRREELRQKRELYLRLQEEMQHPDHGWIYHNNCDGLLYEGMHKFAGLDVDLLAARDESGRWHRTPSKDCFSSGNAKSTISRDMIAGMLFGSDLQTREELYKFAKDRDWKIGTGNIDTVFLTPNFINTLAITIGKGKVIEELWIDPIKSHQRHIVALNAVYRNLTSNTGASAAMDVIKKFKHHDPDNLLYFYFLAKHGKAPVDQLIDVLLESTWFPNDRLPESKDRCSRWVWEMDNNREPCPERGEVHSGGDFTFLATLVLADYVIN